MNITRIGFVFLIVGLILLMNASSSYVSGYTTHIYGTLEQNETLPYVILIGSVGPTTLAIGGADHPLRGSPGGSNVVANVSVHMIVTDPQNNTLAEQDVITPYLLDVDLKSRGAYTISVTNKDAKESAIPLTVIFETNNPENKEADKYLFSLILTGIGLTILVIGFVINLHGSKKQQSFVTNLFFSYCWFFAFLSVFFLCKPLIIIV